MIYDISDEIDEITCAGYMDQKMEEAKKNSSEKFGTLELAKRFPKAWEALPSAYREDDVLEFWIEKEYYPYQGGWTDTIHLSSKPSQEFAIGKFSGFFSNDRKCFVVKDENGNWRNVDPKE